MADVRPGPVLVLPVHGLGEIHGGDDLADLVLRAVEAQGEALRRGDVVVVSSKVVSKALGLRGADREAAIRASTRRVVVERATGDRVTRVVESVAGPVMAAGGVDASNTGAQDSVLLLPADPDAAASDLLGGLLTRSGLPAGSLGVIVSDTAGRPWRAGQTDIAIGAAGVAALDDLRGSVDADGRPLLVTARAVADELAAAADLVKGKASGVPVAIVRGLEGLVRSTDPASPDMHVGARSLVRTAPGDWFAMGHVEAVRAALGVFPGSEASEAVGLRPALPDGLPARARRAIALAAFGIDSTIEIEPVGSADPVPGWTDPSSGDPGITLLDLLAWLPDAFTFGRFLARLEVAAVAEELVTVVGRPRPDGRVPVRLAVEPPRSTSSR